ncbi:MAG: GNAT family N-acetyltransferase [Clostridia bacterium]
MVEITKFTKDYSMALTLMMAEFYDSDAVMHEVDSDNFEKTINMLIHGTPFQDCFVFVEDGRAVGYALIAITYSNEAGGMVAWLDEFFINDDMRGKGIGKKFLEFMKGQYGEFGRFRLEVEDGNDKAEALYKMFGYQVMPYKQMYQELKK